MGPTLFMAHESPSYLFPFISGELRVVNTETILVFGLVPTMFLDNCLSTTNFETRRFYLFFLVALFVVIVLSRQRTATAASLAGLATLFLANYKFLRRNKVVLIILACLAFIAVVILSTGLLPVLLQMLPEQFQRSIEKFATLNARENVWNVAIGWRFVNWDIVRQLFGPPAGEPLDLVTSNGSLWGHSLHSQYIATIMNYGLVGAIAWAALVIHGIVQAFRALHSGTPNRVGLSPELSCLGLPYSLYSVSVTNGTTGLVFLWRWLWRDGHPISGDTNRKLLQSRDKSFPNTQAIAVGTG